MTSNTDLTPLIAEAGQIELYDRAEQVKSALAARDLTLAIRLCEEATREAHSRAKYNCAPICASFFGLHAFGGTLQAEEKSTDILEEGK